MTIVLLSGGLDSCVAATFLKRHKPDGDPAVEAIAIDYGQRHRNELNHAQAIAGDLKIPLTVVAAPSVGSQLSSALTGGTDVPHGHYSHESMAATVVPGRNLLFASIAVGVAASRGHHNVALAVHAGDHPIYPDCRPEFIEALTQVTQPAYGVKVSAPFIKSTKANIVTLGARYSAPMGLSWSCYEGGDLHCGRCGTCVERFEAFKVAGYTDPTVYKDKTYAEQVLAGTP